MPKIAIIYDASFLMRGARLLLQERRDGQRLLLQEHPVLKDSQIVNIVAAETVSEITNLTNGAKEKSASLGRKTIYDLETTQDKRVSYRNETFAGTPPYSSNNPLGSDSPTDKLLLGKAKQLAETGAYDAIVLASHDFGIGHDEIQLKSETNLPIYFVCHDRDKAERALRALQQRIAFGHSTGVLKPSCVLEHPLVESQRAAYLGSESGLAMLASIGADAHTVHLWQFSTDHSQLIEIGTTWIDEHVSQCSFGPRGQILILGERGAFPPVTYAWNFRSGKISSKLDYRYFAVCPNAPLLAAARHKPWGSLVLIDTAQNDVIISTSQNPFPSEVSVVAYSPDGRWVVTGGGAYRHDIGAIHVHDVSNPRGMAYLKGITEKAGPSGRYITALAFNSQGDLLAAGSKGGDVHVYKFPLLEAVSAYRAPHHRRVEIRSLAFNPDGQKLAFGGGTSVGLLTGPLFALESFAEEPQLPAPSGVLRLCFDRTGAKLSSVWGGAGQDQRRAVVIWDAQGNHQLTFDHRLTEWFDVDNDGKYAVTVDADISDHERSSRGDFWGLLRIWRLDLPAKADTEVSVVETTDGVAFASAQAPAVEPASDGSSDQHGPSLETSTIRSPPSTERRIALVIGNSAYEGGTFRPIQNAYNDAQDVAKVFAELGFEVISAFNLRKNAMKRRLDQFARRVRNVDTALVYYAGHGVQHEGINYLVPIDARIEDKSDVQKLINMQQVINRIHGVRIFIVDACRNDGVLKVLSRGLPPTRSASPNRGFDSLIKRGGYLVAFATQPYETASDGEGRNSPFTRALLRHLKETPNLELSLLMKNVCADVLDSTGGAQLTQVVWESLPAHFFFVPAVSPKMSTDSRN